MIELYKQLARYDYYYGHIVDYEIFIGLFKELGYL